MHWLTRDVVGDSFRSGEKPDGGYLLISTFCIRLYPRCLGKNCKYFRWDFVLRHRLCFPFTFLIGPSTAAHSPGQRRSAKAPTPGIPTPWILFPCLHDIGTHRQDLLSVQRHCIPRSLGITRSGVLKPESAFSGVCATFEPSTHFLRKSRSALISIFCGVIAPFPKFSSHPNYRIPTKKENTRKKSGETAPIYWPRYSRATLLFRT